MCISKEGSTTENGVRYVGRRQIIKKLVCQVKQYFFFLKNREIQSQSYGTNNIWEDMRENNAGKKLEVGRHGKPARFSFL